MGSSGCKEKCLIAKRSLVIGEEESGIDGLNQSKHHSDGTPFIIAEGARSDHYWKSAYEAMKGGWRISAGSVLVWYEWSLFGSMHSIVQENFFPGSPLITWAAFGTCFVSRPLGGFVVGWIVDRWGRRTSSLVCGYGMMLATVGQGLLPTHLTSGSAIAGFATGILLIMQCTQGLCAGGEVSSTSVYLAETAPKDALGAGTALGGCVATVGLSLGMATCALIHSSLTPDQVLYWGWRIPYLIALSPSLLSLKFRHAMPETEEFLNRAKAIDEGAADSTSETNSISPNNKEHLLATADALRGKQLKPGLITIAIIAGSASMWYVGPIYAADWLARIVGLNRGQALAAAACGALVTPLGSVFAAWHTDWYGVGKDRIFSDAGLLLIALPTYAMMYYWGTPAAAYLGAGLVFGLGQGLFTSTPYLYITELFPTELRGTAMGIFYNIGVAFAGGFAPLYTRALEPVTIMAPGLVMTAASLLSLSVGIWAYQQREDGKLRLTHIRDEPY